MVLNGMAEPGGEALAQAAGWTGRAGAAGRGSAVGCHSQGHSFLGSITTVFWLLQAAAPLLAKLTSPLS